MKILYRIVAYLGVKVLRLSLRSPHLAEWRRAEIEGIITEYSRKVGS